jgi:hypothetical protein
MLLITYRLITLFVLGAACAAQTGTAPAATPPQTAEQAYKNIQVLKGAPADQLIPAMQFMAASLGVQCDFCHVENAFEKDDKQTKQTARKMIQMLLVINKDNFQGQKKVTCYACHRGVHRPVASPLISEEPAQPAPEENVGRSESSATNLPSVDTIVEKYLQAMGATSSATKSIRLQQGSLTIGTAQFPVEVLTKGPAKRVTTIHFPGGDSVTGFNEQVGWLTTPGRDTHQMTRAELDGAQMESSFQFGMDLRQMFQKLQVQQEDTINNRPTVLVLGMRGDYPPAQLYFDRESGLLVRLLRYVDTPLGLNPTQIDYADYREDGGRKVPFRWTVAHPGSRFTIQIEHAQQDLQVNDEKFLPPPTLQSESPRPPR